MNIMAILWKEWIAFKSKIISNTLGMLVSPLLYLVAFGWGLGTAVSVNGANYIQFVLPGIIAMNTMTSGFSIIAADINMSRSYLKTFEAIMTAPVRMSTYTLARISANVLRVLYGSILVIIISFLFNTKLNVNWYFFLVIILNSFVFSTLGFIAGIVIESHADISKVSTFIITPMSFLCGTFFPVEKFPLVLQKVFEALPLTQTVKALRSGFSFPGSWKVLAVFFVYIAVLLPLAIHLCKKTE